MLRDLELQRTQYEPAPAGPGVHIPVKPPRQSHASPWLVMLTLVVAFVAASYLIWESIDLNEQSTKQVASLSIPAQAVVREPVKVQQTPVAVTEVTYPVEADVAPLTQLQTAKLQNIVRQEVIADSQWARLTVAAPISTEAANQFKERVASPDAVVNSQSTRPLSESVLHTKKQSAPVVAKVVKVETVAVVEKPAPVTEAPVIEKRFRPPTVEQQAQQTFNEAQKLFARGETALAEQRLQKVLRLQASHIGARELLVSLFQKQQRYDELTATLLTGMSLHPQHSVFVQMYARLLLDQDLTTDAIKVLENFSADVKQAPEHFALLAASYQRNAQHNKAAQTYQYVLSVYPHKAVWWLGLGISQQAQNDANSALQSYRRAQASQSLSPELSRFVQERIRQLNQNG